MNNLILEAALEATIARISDLLDLKNQITSELKKAGKPVEQKKRKRSMRVLSPEARERIAEAQRKRWAKWRGDW